MSLDQIIDPADQRLTIDSKNNAGWTKNVVGSDTFVTAIPIEEGSATTLNASTDGALLVNNGGVDQLYFPLSDPKHYVASGTGFNMEANQVTLAGKVVWSADDSFGRLIGNNDGSFNIQKSGSEIRVNYREAIIKNSGGTDFAVPFTAGLQTFSIRIDAVTQSADVIWNGIEYTGLIADGTATSTDDIIRFSGATHSSLNLDNVYVEHLIGAQTFLTLDKLRDLHAYVEGTFTQWNPHRVNGYLVDGIKVLYITADDRNFTNASLHGIATTTGGTGEAPPPTDIPTGKHVFVVPSYEVPDPAPSGLTIGDTYSEIGKWIDGYPQ